MDESGEVTRLLGEIGRGQKDAMNQLLPLVYDELHRLARSYFRRERGEHAASYGAGERSLYSSGRSESSAAKPWAFSGSGRDADAAHPFGLRAQA